MLSQKKDLGYVEDVGRPLTKKRRVDDSNVGVELEKYFNQPIVHHVHAKESIVWPESPESHLNNMKKKLSKNKERKGMMVKIKKEIETGKEQYKSER